MEVNWMWLPTFLGMNNAIKAELENTLASEIEGSPLNEATLDLAHARVIQLLQEKFPAVKGLDDFLDSLKYVYYS